MGTTVKLSYDLNVNHIYCLKHPNVVYDYLELGKII